MRACDRVSRKFFLFLIIVIFCHVLNRCSEANIHSPLRAITSFGTLFTAGDDDDGDRNINDSAASEKDAVVGDPKGEPMIPPPSNEDDVADAVPTSDADRGEDVFAEVEEDSVDESDFDADIAAAATYDIDIDTDPIEAGRISDSTLVDDPAAFHREYDEIGLGEISSDLAAADDVAESDEELEEQYIPSSRTKLCATFGFNCRSGSRLFSRLFSDSLFIDQDDVLMVDLADSSEFIPMGGADLAVGFVDRVQLITGSDSFLSHVQAYVDSLAGSRDGSELLVFLEVDEADTQTSIALHRPVLEAVEQIINSSPMRNDIKLFAQPVSNQLAAGAVVVLKEKFEAVLQASPTMRATQAAQWLESGGDTITTSPRAIASSQYGTVNSSMEEYHFEVRAAEALRTICDDFQELLQQKLQAMRTSEMTISALRAAVTTAAEAASSGHHSTLVEFQKSNAFGAMVYRARRELADRLLTVYRKMAEALLQSTKVSFMQRISRLPGGSSLPQRLKEVMRLMQREFSNTMGVLRGEFLKLIGVEGAGLLSHEGLRSVARSQWVPMPERRLMAQAISTFRRPKGSASDGAGTPGYYTPAGLVLDRFSTQQEKHELLSFMSRECEERKRTLLLSGGYNPYIRTAPYPPTQLQFNYLIEPEVIVQNWEMNRLYDEHKQGPCEDRADALLTPGTATIPFDPNSFPQPREKPISVWEKIQNLFAIEDDDE